MVKLIRYGTTNTYLIKGKNGALLFDTGWAGTLQAFLHALGEAGEKVQDITYILISHYHPDHMGIAQEIAEMGPRILIVDTQTAFVHEPDRILKRDAKANYKPIDDGQARIITIGESRGVLQEMGIDGCLYSTPGHSDDSVSLFLDDGTLFVGDLNPLYELELHAGTQIEKSWSMLLAQYPKRVYYGHAPAADLKEKNVSKLLKKTASGDIHILAGKIVRLADKGVPPKTIAKKTGADPTFVEDVIRMYVTHPGVSIQGILDRIEIKGK